MLASQDNDVFGGIQTFFEWQCKENPACTPEFNELLNNFSQFVANSFETVYVVVDALDESEDRECVAYSLKRVFETCKYAKVFLTSRHKIDIARTLDELPSTSIEATDVAGDIELYIKAEVTAWIKAQKIKLRDPNLEGVICDTLIDGARGIFQWVKCQLDQLCKLRNNKAVRNALNDLPKTLHDTYIRILQKGEAENSDVEIMHRLLKWSVRGVRNLTLSELAECVSIDFGSADESFDFDAVFTDPEDVLLKQGADIKPSGKGKYHNALQTASVSGNKASVKALLQHGIDINTVGGKFGTALTAAVLREDVELAEYLLKKGINPKAPGGIYSGALQAAAATGSIDYTFLLLRYGANINKAGGKFFTPLQAAGGSDNYSLVECLLQRGAEANTVGGHCHSVLHVAALAGLDDACELLMKNGVQWNLPDSKLHHLTTWQIDTATEVSKNVVIDKSVVGRRTRRVSGQMQKRKKMRVRRSMMLF